MSALGAVMYREGKIRATNGLFIFWDVVYPIGYLLVFGVGINEALGFTAPGVGADYHAFFLAGVLGMAGFGIASNTAWSFFMDRDNGIFYEMLTYPISRAQYLLGKVLFNVAIALVQALVTVALAVLVLDVSLAWFSAEAGGSPGSPGLRGPGLQGPALLAAAVVVGTAGWFFFYAIFALWIRRNDAFNTVTSIFYFIFLFASSMFYPIDPLPRVFQAAALANPITWHVDVLRYATIGMGDPRRIALEAAAFVAFTALSFAAALYALRRES